MPSHPYDLRLMVTPRDQYDVIVIGGGHAGVEAAWAAANVLARRGDAAARVALITMDPSKIGTMSCNPAIGGLGKGQVVREIDALGGVMGRAIDATGIQFRMLNTSKGAAVWGPRAQADKYAYRAEVQRLLATRSNLDVWAATIDDLLVEGGRIVGVRLPAGAGIVHADHAQAEDNLRNESQAEPIYPREPLEQLRARSPFTLRSAAVVLTTGTFMRGLMHTGERKTSGGRVDEGAAVGISGTLRNLGFELGRLKTGTPPRLKADTIDWASLVEQRGDAEPYPFSDRSPDVLPGRRFPELPQISCHQTQTTPEAHELIHANLHRAPMYAGQIDAECGPRYCPSIEDKVVRFAQRESHHVFLEPESLHTEEIYCNGISTSLPIDVQERIVHTMPGCERAEVLRWGYAVEYDMVWPHQLDASCLTKRIDGLFLAGQINCTTGYEEAAAQGLVAGLNAARMSIGADVVRFGRDEAYIGVMLDDLVTKTPREPYRLFTSRAEFRLLLRAENADDRLTRRGAELGLVGETRLVEYESRRKAMDELHRELHGQRTEGRTLAEWLRRPEVTVDDVLKRIDSPIAPRLVERVMTDIRYEGYIVRQRAEIKRQQKMENARLPMEFDYLAINGLRSEAAETLAKFRPATMGQAGRLPGVTPADLTLLAVALKRRGDAERDAVPAAVS